MKKILTDKDNVNKYTIIYCNTITELNYLYYKISVDESLKDFKTGKYHGRMKSVDRKKAFTGFMDTENGANILIATKAFGLGIDKKDIELIIHYDIPDSLEDYYQQIGRAARGSGYHADCYLLYFSGEENKKFRGTLYKAQQNTIIDLKNPNRQNSIISLRSSDGLRKFISYSKVYRFARLWDFCNLPYNADADDRIEYICKYLAEEKPDKEILKALLDHYSGSSLNNEGIIDAFVTLLDDNNGNSFNTLLKKTAEELNKRIFEYQINNTNLANALRHHGDKFEHEGNNIIFKNDISGWRRSKIKTNPYTGTPYIDFYPTDISQGVAIIRINDINKSSTTLYYINKVWKTENPRNNNNISMIFMMDKEHRVTGILKKATENPGSLDKWGFVNDIDDNEYKTYVGHILKNINELSPADQYIFWSGCSEKDEPSATEFKRFIYIYAPKKRSIKLVIHGDRIPDYFDMCIMDAIYSIEKNSRNYIYVKTIWEILSGNSNAKFPRADSSIKTEIEKRLEYLSRLSITIEDPVTDKLFTCREEPFLPLKKRTDDKMGYEYEKTPPLYTYAELLGEIYIIPDTLMNNTTDGTTEYGLQATIAHSVITHYLLHRISIFRKSKRGSFIRFSTIFEIAKDYLPKGTCNDPALFVQIVGKIMLRLKKEWSCKFRLYKKNENHLFLYGLKFEIKSNNKSELKLLNDNNTPSDIKEKNVRPENCDGIKLLN